ncbi:MAG: hypothetical protein ACI9DK_001428 [Vicingaceae bacterium]
MNYEGSVNLICKNFHVYRRLKQDIEKWVEKGFNVNLLVEKESFKTYFATTEGRKNLEGLK